MEEARGWRSSSLAFVSVLSSLIIINQLSAGRASRESITVGQPSTIPLAPPNRLRQTTHHTSRLEAEKKQKEDEEEEEDTAVTTYTTRTRRHSCSQNAFFLVPIVIIVVVVVTEHSAETNR